MMRQPKLKFYETAEFKKQNSKWQDKLKNSGFEDLEDINGELRIFVAKRFAGTRKISFDRAADDERYFTLAREFLHKKEFKSKLQKFIWEQHSEGFSERNIEETLRKKNFKADRNVVRKVIKEFKDEMIKKNES